MRYWLTPIHLKYELRRRLERVQIKVAYMIPRWLVYWSSIRLGCHAATGEWGDQVVPDLSFMDALKRWGYDS